MCMPLQNVPRFGQKGEVKATSPGWMRHKLFPEGWAVYATPENVAKHAVVGARDGMQASRYRVFPHCS